MINHKWALERGVTAARLAGRLVVPVCTSVSQQRGNTENIVASSGEHQLPGGEREKTVWRGKEPSLDIGSAGPGLCGSVGHWRSHSFLMSPSWKHTKQRDQMRPKCGASLPFSAQSACWSRGGVFEPRLSAAGERPASRWVHGTDGVGYQVVSLRRAWQQGVRSAFFGGTQSTRSGNSKGLFAPGGLPVGECASSPQGSIRFCGGGVSGIMSR